MIRIKYETLGACLAKKRKDRGLSQVEVSRALGCATPQFLSNIERGVCSVPPKLLKQLIGLYKLSPVEKEKLSDLIKNEFRMAMKKELEL